MSPHPRLFQGRAPASAHPRAAALRPFTGPPPSFNNPDANDGPRQAAGRRGESRAERADGHLLFAREEAALGYEKKDERRIRDAAEKAWLAVCEAVDGAMERHGVPLAAGPMAHSDRREFLESVNRELAKDMAFFAVKLHGDCFYQARCPAPAGMGTALGEVA